LPNAYITITAYVLGLYKYPHCNTIETEMAHTAALNLTSSSAIAERPRCRVG